jgi:hypothetical protein
MSTELPDLKRRLIELTTATVAYAPAASADEREILAIADRLEKQNPTEQPARRADLLDGRWRMRYTSFKLDQRPTLQRLAFGKLPAVEISIDGIYQEVDSTGGHYNNVVLFTRDGARGLQVITGRFKPTDESRLDIDFFATHVRALNGDREALNRALGIEDEADLAAQLESPPLSSQVSYLDDDLRLMRGSYRNLYVLSRDAASPVTLS